MVKVAKKLLVVLLKTLKWLLLAIVILVVSLLFRSQRLPASILCRVAERALPDKFVVHAEEVRFGFVDGFIVRDFRLYDRTRANSIEPVASCGELVLHPFLRRVKATQLAIKRLHDGYY